MKTLTLEQLEHIIESARARSSGIEEYLTFANIFSRVCKQFNVAHPREIKERDYARACRFLGVFPRKSLLNPEIHPIKADLPAALDDARIKETIKQISLQLTYLNGLVVNLTNAVANNSETVH